MLFRKNDKGKTSFAFVLKTQAKAFLCRNAEYKFEAGSSHRACCLFEKYSIAINSWDKPEIRRRLANLVK